jgi:hypothetical protein
MQTTSKEKRGLEALHPTLMQTGLFTNKITSAITRLLIPIQPRTTFKVRERFSTSSVMVADRLSSLETLSVTSFGIEGQFVAEFGRVSEGGAGEGE